VQTLPEGFATPVLTACALACIREVEENGFILFDLSLYSRNRAIKRANAVDFWLVTMQVDLYSEQK